MYVDRYLIKSASSVYNFNVDPVSLSQWRYNWKSMISHILHFSHPSILCWQCVDICAGTMYLHTVHTRARMHINVSAAHMSTSTLAAVLRGRNNQCCFTQCWCRGGTSVLTLTKLSCRDMHRINLYCHLLLIETKWHDPTEAMEVSKKNTKYLLEQFATIAEYCNRAERRGPAAEEEEEMFIIICTTFEQILGSDFWGKAKR